MFIVNIASMAQEQVFSIGTNGDIVTKTKFIEELYSGNYNNVTPYALKFSEKIDAASHIAINNDLTSINNDLTNISKKAANSRKQDNNRNPALYGERLEIQRLGQ